MKYLALYSEEINLREILDEIFSLDMGQYDNLGFGDFAFANLRNIIFGLILGIIFASYLVIFNKRVYGEFVRSLIGENCSSPETAKTITQLGYMKNRAVRSAIKTGHEYRGIVRCPEADEYYAAREQARGEYEARVAASGERAPAFSSLEFKYDFTTARFYIPEDKHFTATERFEKKGTSVLSAIAITAISLVLFFLIIKFLPDIMQFLDNFVGIINS